MNDETMKLNEKAIRIAEEQLRKTYSPDKMLMQAVNALSEEEHLINVEYERLREMYWRYYPELLESVNNINKLISVVDEQGKPPESMGYDLSSDELIMMKNYAKNIKEHLTVLKMLEKFIKDKSREIMPNTSEIATPVLTAKLITLAGGFKNMAFMPASTIQLLGAEKALFRHLRSKAKCPKHGIILQHQDIQSAKNKGKAARQLANHIMIAVRKDYFGGSI